MKDRLQCLTVDRLPCQHVCILSREPNFAAKFDAELESLFQTVRQLYARNQSGCLDVSRKDTKSVFGRVFLLVCVGCSCRS